MINSANCWQETKDIPNRRKLNFRDEWWEIISYSQGGCNFHGMSLTVFFSAAKEQWRRSVVKSDGGYFSVFGRKWIFIFVLFFVFVPKMSFALGRKCYACNRTVTKFCDSWWLSFSFFGRERNFIFVGIFVYGRKWKKCIFGRPGDQTVSDYSYSYILIITEFLVRPLQEGHGCITSKLIKSSYCTLNTELK